MRVLCLDCTFGIDADKYSSAPRFPCTTTTLPCGSTKLARRVQSSCWVLHGTKQPCGTQVGRFAARRCATTHRVPRVRQPRSNLGCIRSRGDGCLCGHWESDSTPAPDATELRRQSSENLTSSQSRNDAGSGLELEPASDLVGPLLRRTRDAWLRSFSVGN
jgi:hypothetical protein